MRNLSKFVIGLAMATSVITFSTTGISPLAATNNTKTLTKHYDTYYKQWFLYDGSIPDIVSKPFEPDSKTKKMLDEAEKAGIISFSPMVYASKGKYYQLTGKTDNFTVFYAGDGDKLGTTILKIGKSDYLDVSVPSINYLGDAPEYEELDIDDDGKAELVFKPSRLFHGTGYYEDIMLIADNDKNGDWKVYLLNPEKYMPEIAKQVEGRIINGKAALYVNGKKEGASISENYPDPLDEKTPGIYLENIVYIDLYDGKLWLKDNPMFYESSSKGAEVILCYPINYEGEGKYSVGKVLCRPDSYYLYSDILESLSEDDYYFTWDNPNFEIPPILIAKKKDCLNPELKYEVNVTACDISSLQNGKLKLLKTLKGDDAKNPLCISQDGLIVKGEHFLYVYGPDPTGKKVIIKYGVEDDKISKFSKHKGYIRIVNDKAQNSTSFEFDNTFKKYENAVSVNFIRR